MAVSHPDRLAARAQPARDVALSCLLAFGLAGASITATAVLPDASLPISLDADSSEFDRRNNLVTFHNVQITQGQIGIAADHARATGLDFDNSQWVFNGHVNIRLPSGSILADAATVEFADHELRIATIRGEPASFEHRDVEEERLARGRAREIVYDVRAGTVTLKEEAWLSEGENEISGSTLIYDIADERVVANGGPAGEERVRVRIVPRPPEQPQPREDGATSEPEQR